MNIRVHTDRHVRTWLISSGTKETASAPWSGLSVDRRITTYNRRIRELYGGSELCQRLGQIEGIGPVERDGAGGCGR